MELDSFTQKLLERTQARRENINRKLPKSPSIKRVREPLSEDKFAQNTDLKTNDVSKQKDKENEGPSPSKRPSMEDDKRPEHCKTSGLKGLAALRKRSLDDSAEIVSSLMRNLHESKEAQGFVKSTSTSKLTYTYEQSSAIKDKMKIFEQQNIKSITSPKESVRTRTVKWPPEPVNKGESEELEGSRTIESSRPGCSKLVITGACQMSKRTEKQNSMTELANVKRLETDPSSFSLAARRAMFENPMVGENETTAPELLSVAERANIFEKVSLPLSPINGTQKGIAPRHVVSKLQPAVVAAILSPKQSEDTLKTISAITLTPDASIKFSDSGVSTIPPPPPMPPMDALGPEINGILRNGNNVGPKRTDSFVKKTVHFLNSPTKNIESHTKQLQQLLFEGNHITENNSAKQALEERKRELEALKNRNNRQPDPPIELVDKEGDNSQNSSLSFEEDISENRVEQDSQLLPVGFDSLSSNEENNLNISFLEPNFEKSSDNADQTIQVSLEIPVCNEIDDVLEEAMDGCSDTDEDNFKSPPRLYPLLPRMEVTSAVSPVKPSSPKCYPSLNVTGSTPVKGSPAKPPRGQPVESESPPLVHSVSFYRRQKQQLTVTPVRAIKRVEVVTSPPSPPLDNEQHFENIELKIRRLQEDLHRQDVQVKQTCQALFLCAAKQEFFGSAEHVEGERLLLISSCKRNAFRSRIEQLKTEAALGSSAVKDQGTLTLSEIKLPLKTEFLKAQIAGHLSDAIHYFFCLIRYREKVIASEMLSTKLGITAGTFSFSNHICLQELCSNFQILFEVYALQTSEEILPHEKKYHIKKDTNKLKLTPRSKKYDSKAKLSPALSSPASTTQERLSNFDVVGSLKLNIENCRHRVLPLEKVPLQSPLEGHVSMRIQLCAEQLIKQKGFLTMFEDVSGFGAWHRRWCVLSRNHLSYWKYPDHEKTEVPIGSIDLRECITPEVGLVANDICARKNTFMLLCVRPQNKGDQNTLVMQSHSAYTTIKSLLSADTKEERVSWCEKLNHAIEIIRKWDPEALKPMHESTA